MELSALHKAVRALVRDGQVEAQALRQLSASERRAVQSLKRRLDEAEGRLEVLLPATASLMWARQMENQTSR